MKRAMTLLTLLLASACGGAGRAGEPDEAALEAFRRGDFERAEAILRDARDPVSLRVRARIHLFHNRPAQAVALLEQAVRAEPGDLSAYPELASAYARADDFRNASRWYLLAGYPPLARKYETLAHHVGFIVEGLSEEARIPYLTADPLPVVEASVNGRGGIFILDTGIGEITLDREFAARAKVSVYGIRTAAFEKVFDEAVLDEVALGSLRVRNVPARLGAPPPTPGLRTDGVIGLSFLARFDFTLDERRGRLTLRRPSPPSGTPPGGVPAVFAGEGPLLVRGKLNGTVDTFVGLATGLPGVAVAVSSAFLQSHGGEVRDLEAGPIRLSRPRTDPGPFPPGLDAACGFPVGFVLGREALKGRTLRLDPRAMRLWIE
jgi:hypothetical protein